MAERWGSPNFPIVAHTPPAICDRCRLIDCAFIHNDSVPKCSFQLCDACTDVAELNEQIDSVHEQLISLIRRRQAVKRRINRHHDELTSRLPMEIISEIFLLVANVMEQSPYDIWRRPSSIPTSAPLLLGLICKNWRNITLGLPRLWSMLNIRYWDRTSPFHLVEQWLDRSSTAPLYVTYIGDSTLNADNYHPILRLGDILRSHATRWKWFIFSGRWEQLHHLFHNLDGILQVDTLDINIVRGQETLAWESIELKHPLCPKNLTISGVSLSNFPLQWANLTHLDASSLYLDELLYIIRHGTNLISCVIKSILESEEAGYPLPTTPIVHPSITTVKVDMESGNLFAYLTLPSLKTFDYTFGYGPLAIDTLVEFLDRSAATLDTFLFDVPSTSLPMHWHERFPWITHLEIGIYEYTELLSVGEVLFRALAETSANVILPNLQELRVAAHITPSSTWAILCEAVKVRGKGVGIQEKVSEISQDAATLETGQAPDQSPHKDNYIRPLRSVYIRQMSEGIQFLKPIAELDIFSMILEIKASGVRFEVVDEFGYDLIACAARIIVNRELPFSSDFEFLPALDPWE